MKTNFVILILITSICILLTSCNARKSNTFNSNLETQTTSKNTITPLPSLNDEANEYIDNKKGIKFKYPENWSLEDYDENTILMTSPIQERDWQTNAYIELRKYEDNFTLKELIDEYLPNFKKTREKVLLKSVDYITTKSGFEAAVIIFEDSPNYTPNLHLLQKEYVIRLDDKRIVYATGSVVVSLWDKYQKQIDMILESISEIGKP